MAAFALKKSFINKLKNIITIASVRIANLTRVRIAIASPIEAKQDFFSALVLGIGRNEKDAFRFIL